MKNKATKIFLLVVGIIIILLLVTPFVCGLVGEQQIRKHLQALPMPANSHLSIQKYHRGWFSSKADMELVLDTNAGQPQKNWAYQITHQGQLPPTLSLIIHQKIWHGPVIFAQDINGKRQIYFGLAYVLGRLEKPADPSASMKDWRGQLLLRLDGALASRFKIPSYQYTVLSNHSSITLQDVVGVQETNRKNTHQFGSIKFSNFLISTPIIQGGFHDGELTFNYTQMLPHVWLGKSRFDLEKIRIGDESAPKFSASGIKFSSHSGVDKGLVYFEFRHSLDKASYQGINYGPGNLNFRIKNIDPQALNTLRNTLSQPARPLARVDKEMQETVKKLLGQGAEFKLEPCNLSTPDGAVSLAFAVNFPNLIAQPQASWGDLIGAMTANSQFIIPQNLLKKLLYSYYNQEYQYNLQTQPENTEPLTVEQIDKLVASKVDALLQTWQQRSYIVPKENNYVAAVRYEKNEVIWNSP